MDKERRKNLGYSFPKGRRAEDKIAAKKMETVYKAGYRSWIKKEPKAA